MAGPLDFIGGTNDTPPSQVGLDLQKEIIRQLGRRRVGPEFTGPGGWWGHAVDAATDLNQLYRMKQARQMQEGMSQNQADAEMRGRFPGLMPAPQPQPTSGPQASVAPIPSQGMNTPRVPNDPANAPNAPSTSPVITGSINPQADTGSIDPYQDQVKQLENGPLASGNTNTSKATWDYKQYTNGFGTKAQSPNEVIDAPTAHIRFSVEWNKAQQLVAAFPGAANLDPGTKAALTSLTFNAGTAWMNSGLGKAVQSGDLNQIRQKFLQYNRAGGVPNEGLRLRRMQEASWIGQNNQAPVPQVPTEQSQTQNVGPMMRLGGEPGADRGQGAPGIQLAQAGQANQFSQPGQGQGYALPNLEGPDQFRNKVLNMYRNGATQGEIQEYVRDYTKRSAGIEQPGAFGPSQIVPSAGGGPPTTTGPFGQFSKGIPISFGDISTQAIPKFDKGGNATGGFSAVIPGEGNKDFDSLDSIYNYIIQKQAQKTGATTTASAQAERYDKMYQAATQHGVDAASENNQLDLALKMVNDPSFIAGTWAQRRMQIKQFYDTYLAPFSNEGQAGTEADATQAFNKLIAGSTLSNVKSLGGLGLGQLRAAEISIIQQMNANTSLNPGAIRAVIAVNQKANQRLSNIGDMARAYAQQHGGRLDPGFDQQVADYVRQNPLFSNEELKEYRRLFNSPDQNKKLDVEAQKPNPNAKKYIPNPNGGVGTFQ